MAYNLPLMEEEQLLVLISAIYQYVSWKYWLRSRAVNLVHLCYKLLVHVYEYNQTDCPDNSCIKLLKF